MSKTTIGRSLTDKEKDRFFTNSAISKIKSSRELVKSGRDWGYVDEHGNYHPLQSIDDYFKQSDSKTLHRTRVKRRLVKPETFIPPVYENGKIVKEGYFEKPVYREYIEEVKANNAPAFSNVIALEKKERVMNDIKNHYQYHRGATTLEGTLAIKRLNRRFPETEGWKIRTDITVTDYNKYYHTIPIVAVNKLEGITELVDLHTSNYDNEMRTSAKMSLAASMFERNHPRTPPVISISKLNIMDIHNDFTVMQQFNDEQLSENFYNGWGVLKGIRGKRSNVDTMREQNIVLSDAYRKIPIDRWTNLPEGSVFTSFDIESDRRGIPIQVAAIKLRVTNGKLQVVDTKQRHYYSPTDEYDIPDYPESFTRNMIRGFRRMEGVKGHRYWSEQEQDEWLGFFEGTLVGSNIIDSDLPKMFPDWNKRQRVINQHGVFDTRLIGETYRPIGKNSLEKLFLAGEHKSLKAFGFTQHDAMEDAAASAIVAMDMAHAGGEMSITAQAALFHRGFVPIGAKTAGQGQIENVLVDANGKMYNVESLLEKFGGIKAMTNGTDFVHSLGGSEEMAKMLDTLQVSYRAMNAMVDKITVVAQNMESISIHPDVTTAKNIAKEAAHNNKYGHSLAEWVETYHEGLSHNTTFMKSAQQFYDLYGGGQELAKVIKDNTYTVKKVTELIDSSAKAIMPTNSWTLIGDTANTNIGSISGAMGNAFGGWSKPFQSLLAATQNSIAGYNATQHYNQQIASSVGGVVQGAGTIIGGAIGGPVGAIIGNTAGSVINTGIQAIGGGGWKARKQARDITIAGQQIAQDFNLIGVFTQLFTAPLALFNKGLRLSTSFLNVFGNTLKQLDISINRTGLTGLSVGRGQTNARSVDRLMGNQAGTAMSGYEDWSSAQAGLFTMGQLDTSRVVASALLGSFNTVYANGGDPVKQQAQLINKLAANNNRNTAYWASIINPDLARQASMLQVMQKYKGVSTWEQLTDPSTFGMYRAGKTDSQMANMYQARFTFGTFTDSLKTMLDKTVSGLWNSLTNSGIFNKFMPALDNIANMFNSGDYKGGWSAVKSTVSNVWSDIGGKEGIAKLWSGIKSGFATLWEEIQPIIAQISSGAVDLFGTLANSWVTVMIEGMKSVVSAANEMFVQLNDIGIDLKALMTGEGDVFYSVSERKANKAISEYSTAIQRNGSYSIENSAYPRGGTTYVDLTNLVDRQGAQRDFGEAEKIKEYYGLKRITDIDLGIATDRDKELLTAMAGMMYKKVDIKKYGSIFRQMSEGLQELLGYNPIAMETKIGMNALNGLSEISPDIIAGLQNAAREMVKQTNAKVTVLLQNGDNGETIAELAVSENGVESTTSNRKWVRNIQLVESATGRTMARYTQALSH